MCEEYFFILLCEGVLMMMEHDMAMPLQYLFL